MPLYVWENKTTGDRIEILRSFDDYQVPPTDEELEKARVPAGDYEKVLGTGIRVVKTNKWGFGKGYWGSKTPGRGRQ